MTLFPIANSDIYAQLLDLLARNAYRKGQFTLASGRKSCHYVNCKPVTLSGIGLSLVGRALLSKVDKDSVAVAGLTLGADPLVSSVAMLAAEKSRQLDALIVRKEAKGHGTQAWLEGPLPPKGSIITVLEDVVTTGGSSLKAVKLLREADYVVNQVITIIDREEGGHNAMKFEDLELHSLFLLKDLVTCAESINK